MEKIHHEVKMKCLRKTGEVKWVNAVLVSTLFKFSATAGFVTAFLDFHPKVFVPLPLLPVTSLCIIVYCNQNHSIDFYRKCWSFALDTVRAVVSHLHIELPIKHLLLDRTLLDASVETVRYTWLEYSLRFHKLHDTFIESYREIKAFYSKYMIKNRLQTFCVCVHAVTV